MKDEINNLLTKVQPPKVEAIEAKQTKLKAEVLKELNKPASKISFAVPKLAKMGIPALVAILLVSGAVVGNNNNSANRLDVEERTALELEEKKQQEFESKTKEMEEDTKDEETNEPQEQEQTLAPAIEPGGDQDRRGETLPSFYEYSSYHLVSDLDNVRFFASIKGNWAGTCKFSPGRGGVTEVRATYDSAKDKTVCNHKLYVGSFAPGDYFYVISFTSDTSGQSISGGRLTYKIAAKDTPKPTKFSDYGQDILVPRGGKGLYGNMKGKIDGDCFFSVNAPGYFTTAVGVPVSYNPSTDESYCLYSFGDDDFAAATNSARIQFVSSDNMTQFSTPDFDVNF